MSLSRLIEESWKEKIKNAYTNNDSALHTGLLTLGGAAIGALTNMNDNNDFDTLHNNPSDPNNEYEMKNKLLNLVNSDAPDIHGEKPIVKEFIEPMNRSTITNALIGAGSGLAASGAYKRAKEGDYTNSAILAGLSGLGASDILANHLNFNDTVHGLDTNSNITNERDFINMAKDVDQQHFNNNNISHYSGATLGAGAGLAATALMKNKKNKI